MALSAPKLNRIAFDPSGLVTVVAQDRLTGEVRMVAHANREAIEATLATRRATFYSRSRQALWVKGETSGNVLKVHGVLVDCDGDAVLYLVDPAGPTCHTGAESCFFTRLDEAFGDTRAPFLLELENTLRARASANSDRSYTKSLLEGGPSRIAAKVEEEGRELARALVDETSDRVVSEGADVVYHLLVGLLARGLSFRDVERELARRFGVSGLDEKAARGRR